MSQLEALKAATSLHDVAYLLGYEPKGLSFILYKLSSSQKYTQFHISKKSGGTREILAPTPALKLLQKRLAELLTVCLAEIEVKKPGRPSISHAFKKEHSILTNAARHKSKRFVLNLDLNDFFPSINFGRVRGFLIKNKHLKLNEKVATVIAQIACHEGKLPQGSPCSPVISNMIGHILDIRLAKLAKKNGCTYSRYADDLTFSTNLKSFPENLARQIKKTAAWEIGRELDSVIKRSGFIINSKKTRMQYKESRQTVTGLTVNKHPNIKTEYYKYVRAMCHSLFSKGAFHTPITSKSSKISNKNILFRIVTLFKKFIKQKRATSHAIDDAPNNAAAIENGTISQLEGMLSFIYQVKNSNDLRSEQEKRKSPTAIQSLYKKFLLFKHFSYLDKPLVLCEGKTDSVYLKCAMKSLHTDYPELIETDGKKFNFKIKFFRYSNISASVLDISGGTGSFKQIIYKYQININSFKFSKKDHPVIILIDNDDGASEVYKAAREVSKNLSLDGTKKFYHIVENLYLLPTPLKAGVDPSKIEDFFEASVLAQELNGKKFNAENVNTDSSKEYGKFLFSEKIIKPNQKNINFKNFKPILDAINEIIKDYAIYKAKNPLSSAILITAVRGLATTGKKAA